MGKIIFIVSIIAFIGVIAANSGLFKNKGKINPNQKQDGGGGSIDEIKPDDKTRIED